MHHADKQICLIVSLTLAALSLSALSRAARGAESEASPIRRLLPFRLFRRAPPEHAARPAPAIANQPALKEARGPLAQRESPPLAPVPKGFLKLDDRQPPATVDRLSNEDLLAGLKVPGWVKATAPDDNPLAPRCPLHQPYLSEIVIRCRADASVKSHLEPILWSMQRRPRLDDQRFHAALALVQLGHKAPLVDLSQRFLDPSAPTGQRIGAIHALADHPARLDLAGLTQTLEAWFPEPLPNNPDKPDEADGEADAPGDKPKTPREKKPARAEALYREDPALVAACLVAYVRVRLAQPDFDPPFDAIVERAARHGDERARQISAIAYAHHPVAEIPETLERLLASPLPGVRRAALAALAEHPTPAGTERILAATQELDPAVRLAAIELLTRFPGPATANRVEELARSESPADRLAAVIAASKLQLDHVARIAASDSDWTVRRAAALALGDARAGPVAETLRRLLRDRSPEVQEAAVRSLAKLPTDQAVPALLEALGSSSLSTRRAAAQALARHWPLGAEFPCEGPPKDRADGLAHLHKQWEKERARFTFDLAKDPTPQSSSASHADVDPLLTEWYRTGGERGDKTKLAERLRDLGPGAIPRMEAYFDRRDSYPSPDFLTLVLAPQEPIYRELAQLWERPGAAEVSPLANLASILADRKLTRVQAVLVVELVRRREASQVWLQLVPFVERDFPLEARLLDEVGLRHPQAVVRRSVCARIAERAAGEDLPRLVRLFDDPDVETRLAAIRAAGRIEDPAVVIELKRVLVSRDPRVRLVAAAGLHRQRDPAGASELWRLGRDPDPHVRRAVIQTVTELAKVDPDGAARLFAQGLNDDQPTVKEGAVLGLEALLGRNFRQDTFGRRVPLKQQIALWTQALESRMSGDSGSDLPFLPNAN